MVLNCQRGWFNLREASKPTDTLDPLLRKLLQHAGKLGTEDVEGLVLARLVGALAPSHLSRVSLGKRLGAAAQEDLSARWRSAFPTVPHLDAHQQCQVARWIDLQPMSYLA